MPNILLVNPGPDSEMQPFEAIMRLPFVDKKAYIAPLQLPTLAALTPDHFEVDLWDEQVHGRIDETTETKGYDLVGITGYTSQLVGAKRIARHFRDRGSLLVAGGAGVSSAPERYRDSFDVLFVGEAEHTWKQFLSDWETGNHRKEYHQITRPDLARSPLPRWDGLEDQMKHYMVGAVQSTRGCPFDCEFCDVIYLFGRQVRQKPIKNVIEEICALERLGVENIFLCDDSFAADPAYAKELLREFIPVNNAFAKPLGFWTQTTLSIARDDELLELLADANFTTLFIGVETPNKASLQETNKAQNYARDMLEDIHKILSYGLLIRAGIIVGFDHDDKSIFDQQFEFIQESCIPHLNVNMLVAPIGTRLWSRLRREGRILRTDEAASKYAAELIHTNIIPRQMSRVELMRGYKRLLEQVYDVENFAGRLKGFVSMVEREPNVTEEEIPEEQASLHLSQLFDVIEDERTRAAVFEILMVTRMQAPFMLRRVFIQIMQYIGAVAMAKPIFSALDTQIAREESQPSLEPYIDRTSNLVPQGFREGYDEVFPELYGRAFDNLEDKSQVPGALVDVFVDFLARFGDSLKKLEDHHRVALQELLDRTIASRNQARDSQGIAHPGEAITDSRRKMLLLGEDVFKAVARNLRGLGADSR